MISSFNDFIRESDESSFNQIVSRCVKDVMSIIKSETSNEYVNHDKLEYLDPITFDLIVVIRKDENPDFESDSHFNNLPWEKLNFDNHGFSIDGNTYTDRDELIVPEIELTLLINPKREPKSYNEIYFKLNDVLAHEIHHLTQVGWNRKPFRTRPTASKVRNNSKKSFKYFLLSDEVESMVKGMYRRSKLEKKPIDEIFSEYLYPFIKESYITEEEYNKVMNMWIQHTVENYPHANFSPQAKKYVDSL